MRCAHIRWNRAEDLEPHILAPIRMVQHGVDWRNQCKVVACRDDQPDNLVIAVECYRAAHAILAEFFAQYLALVGYC